MSNLGDLLWLAQFALAVINWFKELGPTAPAPSKQLPLPAPHLPVQRHKVIVSTAPGTFNRSTGTWN